MTKMERFVAALELAQELAKDISGINSVYWNITYRGSTPATTQIKNMVDEMQKKNGNTSKKDDQIEVW